MQGLGGIDSPQSSNINPTFSSNRPPSPYYHSHTYESMFDQKAPDKGRSIIIHPLLLLRNPVVILKHMIYVSSLYIQTHPLTSSFPLFPVRENRDVGWFYAGRHHRPQKDQKSQTSEHGRCQNIRQYCDEW